MITTNINAFSCCDTIKVWNETEGIENCMHPKEVRRQSFPKHTKWLEILGKYNCASELPLSQRTESWTFWKVLINVVLCYLGVQWLLLLHKNACNLISYKRKKQNTREDWLNKPLCTHYCTYNSTSWESRNFSLSHFSFLKFTCSSWALWRWFNAQNHLYIWVYISFHDL